MQQGEDKADKKFFLYAIMAGQLVTGCSNTLLLKYQNGKLALNNQFLHPFIQTAVMFLGMQAALICLAFKRRSSK